MKYIWNWIDKQNWSERLKFRVVILLTAAVSAAAGLCVWSIVRLCALNHWSWMAIFTGYPVLIAVVYIVIYSLNHEFHNGAH